MSGSNEHLILTGWVFRKYTFIFHIQWTLISNYIDNTAYYDAFSAFDSLNVVVISTGYIDTILISQQYRHNESVQYEQYFADLHVVNMSWYTHLNDVPRGSKSERIC